MHRPLREHFEVPTDAGEALRTFDYIEELEKYIDHLEALRQPDVSGRSEQLKCEHEPVSLEGKYTNCKHCTTILQLKP